ncbi:hypothetical protein AQI70_27970 [Streptomyces curacoi]|uniref:Uncharacterized protein n=1 Tax=Streptomyces curacoi TaxID=146536 RepID=A0A117P1K5_9ACTN|nr:hypothetical protein AQI70_27970 [Streptomyces curacoi]
MSRDAAEVSRSVTLGFDMCIRPLSPYRLEHCGQAPHPCTATTFRAIAICSLREARSARGAYLPPPKPSQVGCENCSPP